MRLWKLLRRWMGRREKNQAPLPSSQLALARLKALYEHEYQPFQMPTLDASDYGLTQEPTSGSACEQRVEPVHLMFDINGAFDTAATGHKHEQSKVLADREAPAAILSVPAAPNVNKKPGVLRNASEAAIRQTAAILAARHGLTLAVVLPSGEVARFGCLEDDCSSHLIWHEGDYRVRIQELLYDMPSDGETLYHALHVVRSGHPGDYLTGPAVLGVIQLYVPPRRQAAEKVRCAIAALRHELLRPPNG